VKPEWLALFQRVAGRRVCWTLHYDAHTLTFTGRVPPQRRWRNSETPHLNLPPGSTDGVHVLAEMELRLVEQKGIYFLARRRWYEETDLDLTRLGPGPLTMELEPLPE
jgi:hypothetical protein